MKKIFFASLAAIFILAFTYFFWVAATTSFELFSKADVTIQAASIAAISSVLVLLVGRYFEQRREAKQRINAEKIEIYKKFFDFYFDLMSHESLYGHSKPQEEILEEMLTFQKNIIFWGSDGVIRAYLDFKERMLTFSASGENPEETAKNVAGMINSVANVLIAMRRDVGYQFTSLTSKDLARLQLATDPETLLVYDHL